MIALIACLAMVSGAAWYRYASTPSTAAILSAVATPEQSQAYYDELTAKILATATATPIAKKDDLTATDLISRQLVSDYISLAQSGQVTSENLEALSTQYAASLSELTQASRITFQDVAVVDNAPAHINAYMKAVAAIYQKYLPAFKGNTESAISDRLADKDYAFLFKIGEAYANQARELKALSVPASLVEAHIDLVNANLLKAAAFAALAKIDEDPAMALAGIITISQTADAETDILNQMIDILKKQ